MDKATSYAHRIYSQIVQVFDEDNENHIDQSELNEEENFKLFFHALATMAPNLLFNEMISSREQRDNLQFNQMCNTLVFENCNLGE